MQNYTSCSSLFSAYKKFISNQTSAFAKLLFLIQENPDVAQLMAEKRAEPQCENLTVNKY